MSRLRGRLEALERKAGPLYKTLTLPDGGTVRYTGDEALEAMNAAIHQDEHPLLSRFVEADTTEGMPGLCRALAGSWERVRGEDDG